MKYFKNKPPLFIFALISLLVWNFINNISLSYAQESLRERIREKITARMQDRISSSAESASLNNLRSLSYGGLVRTYLLHVPANNAANKPRPLVIVLHGGGGTAAGAVRMAQMDSKADKEGFIVVYPNGTGPRKNRLLTWNAWNCCGTSVKNKIDDVGFINALIEQLEKDYSIDPKRIYATGLSNGGMMAYRLGCELSDKIAAISPVAGALNTDTPIASQPISVIIFHGTNDKHVLYNGGVPLKSFGKAKRIDKPVSYAVSFWVKNNGCSPVAQREEHGNIIKETYSGGKNGTEVVVYTVLGQGHAWPGGEKGLRFGNVDEPTREISATDSMWDFFIHHPK